jgi:hypothetical protein
MKKRTVQQLMVAVASLLLVLQVFGLVQATQEKNDSKEVVTTLPTNETNDVDPMTTYMVQRSEAPDGGCVNLPAAGTSWLECNSTTSSEGYRARNVRIDSGWSLLVDYDITMGNYSYYQFTGIEEPGMWSPDGFHFAFIYNGEVRIVDIRDGKEHPFFGDPTGIAQDSIDGCTWTTPETVSCPEQ